MCSVAGSSSCLLLTCSLICAVLQVLLVVSHLLVLLYVTGSEKRGHFGAKFFSIFLAKHEVYLFSFNMNYNLPFKSL